MALYFAPEARKKLEISINRRALLALVVVLSAVVGAESVVLFQARPSASGKLGAPLAPMLQRVIPAVVTLRVTGDKLLPIEITPEMDERHVRGPLMPQKETFRTGGSGVIVDAEKGYILTNNHVVENAKTIDVGLSDGRRMLAAMVGRDVGTDLAVIKVDARDLPSIPIGNSDAARVGDFVVAVGNPFGLEGTATLGIISAVGRTEIGHEAFEDYLQIDAQINPGNSGGALVNGRGQLIGINTVVGGAKAGGFTIGFAIPINMASVVQQEIIKNGRMHRGTVGLVVEDLPYGEAQATGGAVNYGAVVKQVLSNTSAAQKGLKPGNVIVGAARKPVRSAAEYMTRVSTVPLGEQLPIEVYSNGKRTRIWLTVDATAVEPKKQTIGRDMGSMSGITVADIVPGNALYGDVRGAQIVGMPTIQLTNVTSCFEVGDVIVAIGGVKVTTADDLLLRVEQAGVQYRVDIQRDGVPAWVRASR